MPTCVSVVTLLERKAAARVHQALEGRARVIACTTARELADVMRRETVRAVVVEPFDADGASLASTVAAIRGAHPSVAILLHCRLEPESVREVLPFARAGIDELIVHDVDNLAFAIKSRLAKADEHCSAREVLRRLASHVPRTLQPLVTFCLFNASRNLTVESLARAFAVDRKTLSRRLLKEGWPAPGIVLAWSRVLLVSHLIEQHERPVDQIALALDYPSGTALRNALRRYVGLCPHEIRVRGGLACALQAFIRSLSPTSDGRAPCDDRRRAIAS